MTKKFFSKENKIKHEEQFIEHLEKQIVWLRKQDGVDSCQIEQLKYKLSKARLVLKLLTN